MTICFCVLYKEVRAGKMVEQGRRPDAPVVWSSSGLMRCRPRSPLLHNMRAVRCGPTSGTGGAVSLWPEEMMKNVGISGFQATRGVFHLFWEELPGRRVMDTLTVKGVAGGRAAIADNGQWAESVALTPQALAWA